LELAQRKWKRSAKGKKAARREALKRYYGITPEQYDAMLAQQNGLCALCQTPETDTRNRVLCVDHDHATKKVRGLLCNGCNRGLGFFQDKVTVLQTAIEYLMKHKGETS
jgi:hypothetical protein